MADMHALFTDEACDKIFPETKSNEFFEALFGDASEGAYDIQLRFEGFDEGANKIHFTLNLLERPGCCLACNLTYGLPQVFSRHPLLNIKGVVQELDTLLGDACTAGDWTLASTRSSSKSLHQIPLIIDLQ